MGYQTGNVVLSNGQIMCDVAFVDGEIVEVRGHSDIPFDAADVVEVELTHVRWQFRR